MAFKAPRGPSPFERRSASARDRQRFLAKAPAQLASEDPIGVAIVEADDNPHELGVDAPTKKMVLLVDDSPFFRKFIPPGLVAAGFAVTTVASGYDAIKQLDEGLSCVAIVTDLTMPGMSGQEFVKLCRQRPELEDMPIVALSADRDGLSHFEKGGMEGIDAFVPKTSHTELIKVLTGVIKTKGKNSKEKAL